MATIAAMAFRGCLLLLLTAWSTQAYTLGSPKGPASCLRVGTDRILVLIDSSAGSTPEIATVWDWQKEMTLPKPVHSSGLYEFPSCKLIYPLAGWSKFEMPEIAGHGRFLLRATGFMGHRADGLALYDEGHLVKIFESEEIYGKYADEIIYTTSGPDREVFNAEFDEDRMVWQITTQHRGPNLFGKRLRCYWESYTWDARTGEVLSSWRVDWILWGAWAVMAVVAGFLLIRYRRRRKWIAQATGH